MGGFNVEFGVRDGCGFDKRSILLLTVLNKLDVYQTIMIGNYTCHQIVILVKGLNVNFGLASFFFATDQGLLHRMVFLILRFILAAVAAFVDAACSLTLFKSGLVYHFVSMLLIKRRVVDIAALHGAL